MPYAGVDCTLDEPGVFSLSIGWLGFPFPAANVFKDMQNGILVDGNVALRVIHSTFYNIIPDFSLPNESYPLKGFGIHFQGYNNASLFARNYWLNPSFSNCRTAIWTESAAVDIQYIIMDEIGKGIEVRHADMADIKIANNFISCNQRGIVLKHNDTATNFDVHNNYIQLGAPGEFLKGIAISIVEAANRNEKAFIQRNRLHLLGDGVSKGIFINTVNTLTVTKNKIYCKASEGYHIGIDYRNGFNNGIIENEVFGTASISTPDLTNVGLLAINSTSTDYQCNYFENLHTGIRFRAGTASNTKLRTTTFQPPFVNALHYEDDLIVGTQNWNGNKWLGTAGDYLGAAALNEIATSTFDELVLQRYTIHSELDGFKPPSIFVPNYQGAGVGEEIWFDFDPTGGPDICSQPWYGFIPEIKGNDKRIAEEGVSGINGEVLTWEAQKSLFTKLAEGNFDLTNYSEIASFYTTANDSQIGDYLKVETAQKEVYTQEVNLQNQLKDRKQEQRILSDDLLTIDSFLLLNPSENLWTQRAQALTLLLSKMEEARLLINQIEAARIIQAEMTLIENQNLVANTNPQKNEQVFNEVYLNTVAKGILQFDITQQETILAIAEQCPLEGGRVVHKARSLYTLIDDTQMFTNDCSVHTLQSAEGGFVQKTEKKVTKNKSKGNFQIYPNPANTELTINYTAIEGGELVIISALGHIIQKTALFFDKELMGIDTGNWPEGLYYLKIYNL